MRGRARAVAGRDRPRARDRARRPQALGRFHARFGDAVALLHSGLTEAERRDERERIAARRGAGRRRRALGGLRAGARTRPDLRRRGARRVVQAGVRPALRRAHGRREAGARSRARSPCYGTRDAAARELGRARAPRARRRDSAALPPRAGRRPAPRGGLSALGAAARRAGQRSSSGGGKGDPAAEPPRSRARALHCRACGDDDPLSELRRRARAARRTERSAATTAAHAEPRAGAVPRRAARPSSPGSAPDTQRLERELATQVPELELIRLDADTARSPRLPPRRSPLRATPIAPCSLGTQMVAKGHHFERRRSRGGDRRRHRPRLPDFRAEERTFQLLTQLAGRKLTRRAGRYWSRPSDPTPVRSSWQRATTSPRFLDRRARAPARARIPAVPPSRSDSRQRA